MGVDGFRLDAVQYLMEDHGKLAGSPGTHQLLHDYAAYVRRQQPNTYTVGEVYADIGTELTYYPDQLDSYFAFELADSIIDAARKGSARGVLAPALRLQSAVPAWRYAPFLRNHDQPRTRSELGGDFGKSRVAAFLLFTLPGLPFVYYGEEIGMTGVKPDPRLRTPMQWNAAAGAGFTRGTPWERLQDDSATTTVEAQDADSTSLLNFYRRMIHLRTANSALANGALVPLTASQDAVAAYLRRDGRRIVLAVANLGDSPASGVKLSSGNGALPAGRWTARTLLGGDAAPPLTIGGDGRLPSDYALPTLQPKQGYLFELTLGAAPRTKTR
jgi:glycosidase